MKLLHVIQKAEANLKDIPEENFKVYCLPMKIEGLDALTARILVEF